MTDLIEDIALLQQLLQVAHDQSILLIAVYDGEFGLRISKEVDLPVSISIESHTFHICVLLNIPIPW